MFTLLGDLACLIFHKPDPVYEIKLPSAVSRPRYHSYFFLSITDCQSEHHFVDCLFLLSATTGLMQQQQQQMNSVVLGLLSFYLPFGYEAN